MAAGTQIAREIKASSENATRIPGAATARTPEELAGIVATFASSGQWLERVRLRADRRWFERLYYGPEYDVWVISWMPGQSTGFHDHGTSCGAFVVTTGRLEEHRPGERGLELPAGEPRAFGANYAHDVRNVSNAPAISIHAYSPPLTEMNEYAFEGGQLVPRISDRRRSDTVENDWRAQKSERVARTGVRGVEEMVAAARMRLHRLFPDEAYEAATKTGAVLVDIRPASQRAVEGSIDGAMPVERNVLEWRFDPSSDSRLPVAINHDVQLIVFCSEGYTSSLAAAALQDLGLWRATDIVGGFQAWRAKRLPIAPPEGVS
jgi:rhodanese-related sulfurtransferase